MSVTLSVCHSPCLPLPVPVIHNSVPLNAFLSQNLHISLVVSRIYLEFFPTRKKLFFFDLGYALLPFSPRLVAESFFGGFIFNSFNLFNFLFLSVNRKNLIHRLFKSPENLNNYKKIIWLLLWFSSIIFLYNYRFNYINKEYYFN